MGKSDGRTRSMGKLAEFSIILDKPQGIFHAGQRIEGNVLINLNDEMKIKGIHLKMSGYATVHKDKDHAHDQVETCFQNNLTLYHNSDGIFSGSSKHPSGSHNYKFSMLLPQSVPSSLETKHCNVRYSIVCTIEKRWKSVHTRKRAITVISELDLNGIPDAHHIPENMNSKSLYWWCCASVPIEATVRLARKGFVPGESIPINAQVTNGSNRRINKTWAKIIMKTSGHIATKIKSTEKVVVVKRMGQIEPGESQSWNDVLLPIPPLPPTGLKGCSIIDIDYYVKFGVDISGPSRHLTVKLPIIIGTEPLHSLPTQTSPPAGSHSHLPSYDAAVGIDNPAFLDLSASMPPDPAILPSESMPPTYSPDASTPNYSKSFSPGSVDTCDEGNEKPPILEDMSTVNISIVSCIGTDPKIPH